LKGGGHREHGEVISLRFIPEEMKVG